MLSEEALILIAMLAATGLLVLGVLELVWPSAARTPVRRVRPPLPRARSPFEDLLQPREARPRVEPTIQAPSDVTLDARARLNVDPAPTTLAPTAASDAAAQPLEAPQPFVETPRTVSEDGRETSTDIAIGAPADDSIERQQRRESQTPAPAPEVDVRVPAPPVRREPRPHVLPIEACVSMFDEGRYAEVISLGSAALEVHDQFGRVTDRVGEAALTALVGRAKQQLGDRDGAREAFSAAVRAADPSLRPTYVAHVVELANTVAGEADADAAQVRELLETAASVDDALTVVPGDASLERARTAVRGALATACERLVTAIVAGEGDRDARALVARALADESMPADWRQRLGEQLTPISSAEIGQLTAQAIRCVQEGRDGDAVDLLARADRLFAALPPGTVPDERLEEFERRLWWGYTKVGLSRIDMARFEDAMDPLFRALHLSGVDDQRLAETRGALAGALEAMIDEQASLLAARGAQSVDLADVEKLSALARTTIERGVSEEELADALTKLETLTHALSQSRRA